MKAIWTKLVNAIKSLLAGTRQLFYVVWTSSQKQLADILNDKELQKLALEAVVNAVNMRLSGDAAWTNAFAHFRSACEARGWALGRAILETVLQTAYTVYKYSPEGKAAELPEAPTPAAVE